MPDTHPTPARERGCDCSPETAWDWVDSMAGAALDGDRLSVKLLPRVVWHALTLGQRAL